MHAMNNSRVGVYDGKIAGLYDLEETLGSGHFAVVKLARHVFTGEKVAVKVIDKTKLDEVSRAHLFQEVRCMKLVQHPNVVRLYDIIDTQTKLYLVLELGDGGDLYDYIMKHESGLSENLAKEYFRQIVRAISYCHQLHVVHRDLKPENVVFFEKLGVVKLTDFGFSNKFCPGQKLDTSCGSLAYSAPEILLGDSYDAPAVDVWSLGVILYMLVCGHAPFQEANDSETLTMIMDCKYVMPAHVSTGCRRLIGTMLVRAPEKRSTLSEIAQDIWLMEGDQVDHGPELLPLVSRQLVSEEHHTFIIQKMVNGNIATKEEISDALDRNDYNHITATYFLMAETILRAHRREHTQTKRPDVSLGGASQSSLSPRSRINAVKQQHQKNVSSKDASNTLSVPSNDTTFLTIPGAAVGGGPTSRIRKCSIVQEEDDEEELSTCGGCDDSLSRRGSRSEGRINIAIQDRIAESERLKNDEITSISKVIDGISGVTLVSNDSGNNTKERLGVAGRGGNMHTGGWRQMGDFRPRTADVNKHFKAGKLNDHERSNSVDKCMKMMKDDVDIIDTKFLVDSATIQIPLNSSTTKITTAVPKYKTMPSPTRPNAILTGTSNCLNEIYEEGTDIGSSDSATTTPRLSTRQNHFINNRTQSQGSVTTTTTSTTTRRSKFHKTRTTSCSSSDASDDDSENRKKRAHKIVDVTKPIQYRRDSHDDSSDSQDPGNPTTSSGGNNTTTIIQITSSSTTTSNNQDSSSQNSGQHNNSAGRQNNVQQIGGFRRHRAGRRRAGETRLRESQSLNRITEVQESEITLSSLVQVIPPTSSNAVSKPKGFSARLFYGFRKTETSQSSQQLAQGGYEKPRVPSQSEPPDDKDVESALGAELAKALRVSESTKTTSSNSTTKKLKILGKYFQVHKKLCLPGIFQRGRLYKAQSCGSIVRDKVNQTNTKNCTTTSNSSANTTRHSALFSDKGRILRNCMGATRLLGSDSDINQNNEKKNQETNLFTISSSKTCSINKTPSPIHHIDNAALCSSKC